MRKWTALVICMLILMLVPIVHSARTTYVPSITTKGVTVSGDVSVSGTATIATADITTLNPVTTGTVTTLTSTTSTIETANITTGIIGALTATTAYIQTLYHTTYSLLKGYYFPDSDTADHYDVGTVGTIAWCQAQIGANDGEIVLTPDTTYNFSDDFTLNAGIVLVPASGSLIKPASGKTVTINNLRDPGPVQIFDVSAGGVIAFGSGLDCVKSEWWGENTTPGTTDMSEEMLAAVTAGQVIQLGDTTYLVDKTTLVSNRVIRGEGKYRTVLKLKDSTDAEMFDGTSLSNITFKDLGINGNKANQTIAANLLHFTTCTNITVDNCYIYDGEKDAIYFTNCDDLWVTNCHIKDNLRNGISCGSGTDTSLRAHFNFNTISGHNGVGDTGVALEAAANSEVIGNILIENTNTITIVGIAGQTEAANNNSIIGNTLTAVTDRGYGIIIRSNAAESYGNSIIGNTIDGTFLAPIYLHTSSLNTVSGNIITNASAVSSNNGLTLNASSYNSITGNLVEKQWGNGVLLGNGSTYNTINGNTVIDNSKGASGVRHGINIADGDYNTISGNTSSGADHGVGIQIPSGSDYNVISGNMTSGNVGIGVNNASGLSIINGFINNIGTPISITATGSDDDLYTLVLSQDFDHSYKGLRFKASGVKTGANDDKTLKIHFGSSSYTFNVAANDTDDWYVEGVLFFASATVHRMEWSGYNGVTHLRGYEAPTADFSAGTVTLKVTGNRVNAGDAITQNIWMVEVF